MLGNASAGSLKHRTQVTQVRLELNAVLHCLIVSSCLVLHSMPPSMQKVTLDMHDTQ